MTDILIVSCDPGGANAVTPLIDPLRAKGFSVKVIGRGPAIGVYKRCGIEFQDLGSDTDTGDLLRSVENEFQSISPKLVLTATSAEDFTERYFWKTASSAGVMSLAILDQWINYGIRFSEYPVTKMDMYLKSKTHSFVPNRILVMDERAKKEAIMDGLDPEIIEITGQPHFEEVKKRAEEIKAEEMLSVREKYGLSKKEDILIVFASEPIKKDYGPGGRKGYDEDIIFEELLSAVDKVSAYSSGKIAIVYRPHPREDVLSATRINECVIGKNTDVYVDHETEPILLAASADAIVGMSSMFLIESTLMGKCVISAQIGLRGQDPYVLSRMGKAETITTLEGLCRAVHLVVTGEGIVVSGAFTPEFDAVNKTILVIERFL